MLDLVNGMCICGQLSKLKPQQAGDDWVHRVQNKIGLLSLDKATERPNLFCIRRTVAASLNCTIAFGATLFQLHTICLLCSD